MRLYSYVLAVDDGAAPNPFGGVCTLTICKPAIRRTAEEGDWIVGLGPTNGPDGQDLSHHIIYAMRVSRKMKYADYDQYCRKYLTAKLPDWSPKAPFEHQVGDCLYELNSDGQLVQRRGVHNANNVQTDTYGVNALLAEEVFYYFGDRPVELPSEFECIRHPYQGHKVNANAGCKDAVIEWMLGGFGEDRRPRILYGRPIHRALVHPENDAATWGVCGKKRAVSPAEEESGIC